MKKKYTKKEIALTIQKSIITKYSNEQYFYEQLKPHIDRHIKEISGEDLTDVECKKKGIDFAKSMKKEISLISTDLIEYRISEEIVNTAALGIDLKEYDDYISNFSNERIISLINFAFEQKKLRIAKKRNHS